MSTATKDALEAIRHVIEHEVALCIGQLYLEHGRRVPAVDEWVAYQREFDKFITLAIQALQKTPANSTTTTSRPFDID